MKNIKRTILSLLSACLLFSMFAVQAFAADPVVTFDSSSDEFVYTNVSVYTDGNYGSNTNPDLFPELKNIVPGDELTQDITLKVKNVGSRETIKIYLYAENATTDYEKLVEWAEDGKSVTYTVEVDGTEITGTVGLPDDEDFGEKVLIGSYKSATSIDFTVTLNIPIDMDNDDITNLEGSIDWIFHAEITTSGGNTSTDDEDDDEEDPEEDDPTDEEEPTEEVPTEEEPTEEEPTEEVPTEEVPTEEVPTEEVPTKEVPTEEVPTKEIPTTPDTGDTSNYPFWMALAAVAMLGIFLTGKKQKKQQ